MTEPVWMQFLTLRDKEVFAAAGYGSRAGWGKRPALLVIDVNYDFCGDKREPILESVKRWRNSCGEDAWDALPVLKRVIDAGPLSNARLLEPLAMLWIDLASKRGQGRDMAFALMRRG